MNRQDSEINQNIRILNERIVAIEKINDGLGLKIEQMEKDSKYSFRKDSAEINKLKNDIIEIKKKIKNTVLYLHHLINELKLRTKREELKSVEKKIENLTPYDFVTAKEAEKMVKEIVK